MVNETAVRFKVERLKTLVSSSTMVAKLLEVLDNPALSLWDIAGFVSKDPMLTAHLLKVVNSPAFGFMGRVTSITHALLLLGLNAVKGLLLGVEIMGLTKGMQQLWRHSVATAVMAQTIAQKAELRGTEELFVAGLLHDIGKVFLNLESRDDYRRALTAADAGGASLIEVEQEMFGISHAEIAGVVLQRWHLSPRLVEPIRFHHEPSLAKKQTAETAVVHFADILARARGNGPEGHDSPVTPVDDKAWVRLNLSRATIKDVLWESERMMQGAENLLSSS